VATVAPFRRFFLLAAGSALLPGLVAAQVPRRSTDAASSPLTPPALEESSQTPSGDTRFGVFQRQIARAVARGDIAEAVEIAERQYSIFPDEMKASADLGLLLYRRGQISDAEPHLRRALSQQSSAYTGDTSSIIGEINLELGQIELDGGRPKGAIPLLERAIDGQPKIGLPRFLLAIALFRTGDTQRAERENASAFQIDSTGARALNFALLARNQRITGAVDDAAATVEAGLTRFPNALDLRFELALARRAQNRSAEALYELLYARALRSPNMPSTANFDNEIRALRKEANVDGSEPELKAAVTCLDALDADRPDEALAAIQVANRLNGAHSLALDLLVARAYVATGRYSNAERLLMKLAEQQPTSVPTLAMLANLYILQGRTMSADTVLARAKQLDSTNPEVRELIERRGR
jgi:tetratricopeptide (TPR) repeat protein